MPAVAAEGPLAGIKVLDLTVFINGPSATGQMAEQGALHTTTTQLLLSLLHSGLTPSPRRTLESRDRCLFVQEGRAPHMNGLKACAWARAHSHGKLLRDV